MANLDSTPRESFPQVVQYTDYIDGKPGQYTKGIIPASCTVYRLYRWQTRTAHQINHPHLVRYINVIVIIGDN